MKLIVDEKGNLKPLMPLKTGTVISGHPLHITYTPKVEDIQALRAVADVSLIEAALAVGYGEGDVEKALEYLRFKYPTMAFFNS